VRGEILEVNRARKLQQEAALGQLQDIEAEWMAVVRKNKDIELACREIEQEIASLRQPKDIQPEASAAS
jgi:pre-mRNA-splicing factor SPF27